jgi:lipid-binding SYLF domain-containing protein
MLRNRIMSIVTAFALGVAVSSPALALTDQEELVDRARVTIESLLGDPDYLTLQINMQNAQAVLIVPQLIKGGFFVGGEGGNGVLLARNADGSWSDPSFVVLASGSLGVQFGGSLSELVLTIMTERGLNSILDRKGRIGADVSAAMIVVGAGAKASTGFDANADMYAFSRGKGLFVGGAVEGGVISEKANWNSAYYGTTASSRDILSGKFNNPQSASLSAALPH